MRYRHLLLAVLLVVLALAVPSNAQQKTSLQSFPYVSAQAGVNGVTDSPVEASAGTVLRYGRFESEHALRAGNLEPVSGDYSLGYSGNLLYRTKNDVLVGAGTEITSDARRLNLVVGKTAEGARLFATAILPGSDHGRNLVGARGELDVEFYRMTSLYASFGVYSYRNWEHSGREAGAELRLGIKYWFK